MNNSPGLHSADKLGSNINKEKVEVGSNDDNAVGSDFDKTMMQRCLETGSSWVGMYFT